MPETPLIGRVARPDFNILGLLIGGPRYMTQYLGQQSQADTMEKQMALNSQSAQQLLASPQFANAVQARDKPAWNLWAEMQGGNDQTAALGSSLLERAVSQGYGQDMAKFTDSLERSRMAYGQDLQLQTAQKLAQQQADFRQQQVKILSDPTAQQSDISRNVAAKALGIDVPPGYVFTPTPDGSYGFKPAIGSEPWHKMMDEVNGANQVMKGVSDLLTMKQQGTDTQGAWESTKAATMFAFKAMTASGALDQGFADEFNKLVPDRWDQVSINPKNAGIIEEKLKTTLRMVQGARQGIGAKWLISPDQVPNTAGGALPVPGRDIPPPPEQSPLTVTRDATAKQGGAAPQQGPPRPVRSRTGNVMTTPAHQAGSVWDWWTGSGGAGRTRGR